MSDCIDWKSWGWVTLIFTSSGDSLYETYTKFDMLRKISILSFSKVVTYQSIRSGAISVHPFLTPWYFTSKKPSFNFLYLPNSFLKSSSDFNFSEKRIVMRPLGKMFVIFIVIGFYFSYFFSISNLLFFLYFAFLDFMNPRKLLLNEICDGTHESTLVSATFSTVDDPSLEADAVSPWSSPPVLFWSTT